MPSNRKLFTIDAAPNLPVPSILIGARANDFSVRLIRNKRLAPVFGEGIAGCDDDRRRWESVGHYSNEIILLCFTDAMPG